MTLMFANKTIQIVNLTFFENSTKVKLPESLYFVLCVFLMTIWMFGSTFNATCLYVFLVNQKLHTPTNILIIGLSLSDFCICFFVTPMAIINAIKNEWIWGATMCTFNGFVTYFLSITSIHILMMIALFRYAAISRPSLGNKITSRWASFCSGICYFIGFFWAILPLFGWNTYGPENAGIACNVKWNSDTSSHQSYVYSILILGVMLPFLVMIFSYSSIMATIRRMNREGHWDADSQVGQINIAIEKSVLKTSLMILCSFLCCWMPSMIVSIVTLFFGKDALHPVIRSLPSVLLKAQGLLDPIIYVSTNKQVREATYHLFCYHEPTIQNFREPTPHDHDKGTVSEGEIVDDKSTEL